MPDANKNNLVSLTQGPVSHGGHVCEIFSSDDERQASIFNFILGGLRSKERTTCYSDKTTEQAFVEFLKKNGMPYDAIKKSGAFTLVSTDAAFYQDDRFDPDRLLNGFESYIKDSLAQGYPAVRAIAEMEPGIRNLPDGARMIEYEARMSILLRKYPVTAMCQYDARVFDGAFIMDILKVHPMMVVRGSVIHNPFYIEPEEFLERQRKGA